MVYSYIRVLFFLYMSLKMPQTPRLPIKPAVMHIKLQHDGVSMEYRSDVSHIDFWSQDTALIQRLCLFEGGAYFE